VSSISAIFRPQEAYSYWILQGIFNVHGVWHFPYTGTHYGQRAGFPIMTRLPPNKRASPYLPPGDALGSSVGSSPCDHHQYPAFLLKTSRKIESIKNCNTSRQKRHGKILKQKNKEQKSKIYMQIHFAFLYNPHLLVK
jgi:hypothetical protein